MLLRAPPSDAFNIGSRKKTKKNQKRDKTREPLSNIGFLELVKTPYVLPWYWSSFSLSMLFFSFSEIWSSSLLAVALPLEKKLMIFHQRKKKTTSPTLLPPPSLQSPGKTTSVSDSGSGSFRFWIWYRKINPRRKVQ